MSEVSQALQGVTVISRAGNRVCCRTSADRLIPMLRNLSLVYELPYADTSVRGQATVWASCSARKNISLNYKLLFLPQELVHYVLIHELCHTQHLNHSQRFWTLVQSIEPNYEHMDKELRNAWRFIPPWVEAQ